MKDPWKKYLLIAFIVVLILIVTATIVRPRAYGIPIENQVYRLPKALLKSYDTRSLDKINQVVIHHSATESGSPESYALYHIHNNGWPGIGYHYVISKAGKIVQTQFLKTVSFHTSGQNTRSVGICLTGNYDTQEPPAAQLDACVKLIKYLEDKLGRPLAIAGHNAYSAKSCPGSHINVNLIQQRVKGFTA